MDDFFTFSFFSGSVFGCGPAILHGHLTISYYSLSLICRRKTTFSFLELSFWQIILFFQNRRGIL